MSDEAFHEIQLNGKQLVFLFMAATVVSVVIFLCGVMVGRGVRGDHGPEAVADQASVGGEPAAAPPAAVPAAPRPADPPTSGVKAGSPSGDAPPPADESDVIDSLTKDEPAGGSLKAPARNEAKPAPPKATPARPAPEPPPAAPARAAAATPKPDQMPTEPGTFAVQLAALKDRGEADALARRLVGKGYNAYVIAPSGGKSSVYKVQVGRFKTRQDAEKVAARLKKDEQFSPWVTR
jgi:cell division septation protein DedD